MRFSHRKEQLSSAERDNMVHMWVNLSEPLSCSVRFSHRKEQRSSAESAGSGADETDPALLPSKASVETHEGAASQIQARDQQSALDRDAKRAHVY